ncbi:hypothetical protein D1AOALGA4SA_8879 [Olavius algarvensis Delta 1 endosymbiont]|nr:hypothetical protein D1AOALGA4SA_8879 [Olavius algarvensis Delta 1 endosymbiont]
MTEVRGQKTRLRSSSYAAARRGQKTDDRSQRSDDKSQMPDDRT